jgi:hypothetical protein
VIVLPAMPAEQTASWLGLLDLYERLDTGWTLIGGQLVHLHCAERGESPVRPTNDADTVVDVRADPKMLHKFTEVLVGLGFASAGISAEGHEHRWTRGAATIDVLLPEGIGERARLRRGVFGSPSLSTGGGTQALARSETVSVTVDGREGSVRRPNLVGSLIAKAAAHGNAGDRNVRRHREDFVALASLVAASDFREAGLTKADRGRIRIIVEAIRADREVLLGFPEGEIAIERVVLAAGLSDR